LKVAGCRRLRPIHALASWRLLKFLVVLDRSFSGQRGDLTKMRLLKFLVALDRSFSGQRGELTERRVWTLWARLSRSLSGQRGELTKRRVWTLWARLDSLLLGGLLRRRGGQLILRFLLGNERRGLRIYTNRLAFLLVSSDCRFLLAFRRWRENYWTLVVIK
jgi:hypothetical protein